MREIIIMPELSKVYNKKPFISVAPPLENILLGYDYYPAYLNWEILGQPIKNAHDGDFNTSTSAFKGIPNKTSELWFYFTVDQRWFYLRKIRIRLGVWIGESGQSSRLEIRILKNYYETMTIWSRDITETSETILDIEISIFKAIPFIQIFFNTTNNPTTTYVKVYEVQALK